MRKLGVAQLTTLRIGIENGNVTTTDILKINQMKKTQANSEIAKGKAMILETRGLLKKHPTRPGWMVTRLGREVYNRQRKI